MKRIKYLIHKLAVIASKSASLAIAVAGLFATSQAALAGCSFTWGTQGGSPVFHVPANQPSFGYYGTLHGISATNGSQNFNQTGNFTVNNLAVEYQGNGWWYQNSAPTQAISIPSSPSGVSLTGIVPPGAKAGQVVYVGMNIVYDAFQGGGWNPLNWFVEDGCGTLVTIIVDPACSGNAALIQGTFGSGAQANFEVVLPNDEVSSVGQVPGAGFTHYYRDNYSYSSEPWYSDAVFESAEGPVGAVSLIESSFNNLEVVARTGTELAHFYRDHISGNWSGAAVIANNGVAGTPSLIQSTPSGNFEVVTPLEAGGLAHYTRVGNTWSLVQKFAQDYNMFSDASLIQNTVTGGLEVVARTTYNELLHFSSSSASSPFGAIGTPLATNASGTPSLVQASNTDFEVVFPLVNGGVGQWYRPNSSPSALFLPAITQVVSGSVPYVSTSLIKSGYGNLEVVARSGACSLEHYYQQNYHLGPWVGPAIIVP